MSTYAPTETPVRPVSEVTEQIRTIARDALQKSRGRRVYPYTEGKVPSASGTGLIKVSVNQLAEAGLLRCNRSCMVAATAAGKDPDYAKKTCTGCNERFHPVAQAKVDILWLLLDPALDLVGKTARRNPAVSDYMQEIIRQRLEEIIEQKVLQNPRDFNYETTENGLDLARLIRPTQKVSSSGTPMTKDDKPIMLPAADPVAWARQLLLSSLAPTTKRVFNNERANLTSFDMEITTHDDRSFGGSGLYRDIVDLAIPLSAEEQYLADIDEDTELHTDLGAGESSADVFDKWELESHNKRGLDKLTVSARAIHKTFRLPELVIPETASEIRHLQNLIAADPTLSRRSLRAFHDLIAGEPSWDQRQVEDVLISLWNDYTAEQAEDLLDMSSPVPQLLVDAALALPLKPGRAALRAPRALIRAASGAAGWSALASRVFDAYLAEHYSWFNDHDNRGRTDEATEEFAAAAADWPAAAAAVLAWEKHPAGAANTVAGVASWIAHVMESAAA